MEIYVKAGFLDKVPQVDNPPVRCTFFWHTQTRCTWTSHDPMHEIKIIFVGDQSTRVRFVGAKICCQGYILHAAILSKAHLSNQSCGTKILLLQYLHSSQKYRKIGPRKFASFDKPDKAEEMTIGNIKSACKRHFTLDVISPNQM